MRFKYVLSEVATGLWRNVTMTIAMMITMAVSLTMLGASLLLYLHVNKMKDYYFARVEVSIFLKNEITPEQRESLRTDLESNPLVERSIYVSKADAYEQFKIQFRDAPDLVAATKPDALPESFRVKLKDPKQFQQVSDQYKTRDGVSEVVDQQRLLGKLFSVLASLQHMALIVAIVQGLAALLLVANTIQVAAYSKRREVAVMKLVGAANWFIQLPFVLEAVFAGLIGSIIAFLILVAGRIFLLDGSLKSLATLLTPVDWSNVILMLPVLAGIAAAVNAVAGWITLRFYVRV